MRLAPVGWHVPNKNEFPSGNLKEAGTIHWQSPNTGATNESGFSALLVACRDNNHGASINYGNLGKFGNIGKEGGWWSINESSSSIIEQFGKKDTIYSNAEGMGLHYDNDGIWEFSLSKRKWVFGSLY